MAGKKRSTKGKPLSLAGVLGINPSKQTIDAQQAGEIASEEYEKQVKEAMRRLLVILQKNIDAALRHPPAMYLSTGQAKKATQGVDIETTVSGNTITATCTLKTMNHHSDYCRDGQIYVNVLRLLDTGYRVVKPVWFKNIEWFGYRRAANIINRTIAEFNQSNPLGMRAEIIFGEF